MDENLTIIEEVDKRLYNIIEDQKEEKLHPVGFEPTHSKILELESSPLDQLGQRCDIEISQNHGI
jgi:hypothetical protein